MIIKRGLQVLRIILISLVYIIPFEILYLVSGIVSLSLFYIFTFFTAFERLKISLHSLDLMDHLIMDLGISFSSIPWSLAPLRSFFI